MRRNLQPEMDKRIEETSYFWGRYIHFPGYFSNGYRNKKFNPKGRDSVITILENKNVLKQYPKESKRQILSLALTNARGLKGSIDGTKASYNTARQEAAPFQAEWHKKFTLSVISMLLFLIAAPLGAIIKKGGIGMPLVISVVMFVLFYAVNLVGEKIGVSGAVPLWMGMWLSSIVLLPVGLWITYRASQDSHAISLDSFFKLFKNTLIKPIQMRFSHKKSV